MYTILATNVETLREKGWHAKDGEVSVAVLDKDIYTKTKPTFYAFRQGQIYDPTDGFKPNIIGNHKLPEKLIEEYFKILDVARENLEIIQKEYSNTNNDNGDTSELKNIINQKQIRIDEQAAKIAELSKNKGGNNDQVKQLESMINTLKEMQGNRIEIKIGEKTKIVEEIVHESFEKIVKVIMKGHAAYMYGSAGTGKSKLAEQVADSLELSFYPASTVTQEFKLTGFVDGNGRYHETNFYKAMKYGGIFFLDEMDSCAPEVLVSINGALANGYFDFPNETVRAHKDFRVIAAGNTIGRGGDAEYTGRFALDISTLDRFLAIKIEYSTVIDNAVAQNNKELVDFAQAVRQAAENSGIQLLMSYRAIARIIEFEDMFDLVEVMDMTLIKGTASDDVMMLARNMNISSNNKYYQAFKGAA